MPAPEDVSGAYSYPDFLEAIADPAHPEHERMLEWGGGAVDSTAIDHEAINRQPLTIRL